MLADLINSYYVPLRTLDDLLEKGWFRSGTNMFTTHILGFDSGLYSAIWLRIKLSDFCFSKSQLEILKKNEKFRIEVKYISYDEAKENLFQIYRKSVDFEAAVSLEILLGFNKTYFYTHEISVYDNQKLIACGIFDKGITSAMGIVSFFDPAYKKNSLGKFLLLKKIEICKQAGFEYFYPGYFSPGLSKFDYKLKISKNATEYYELKTDEWRNMERFDYANHPFLIIEQKTAALMAMLTKTKLEHNLFIYDYFDLNMSASFKGQDLLESPIIIVLFYTINNEIGLYYYDVLDEDYKLILCEIRYEVPEPRVRKGHLSSYILKPIKFYLEEKDPNILIEKTIELYKIK